MSVSIDLHACDEADDRDACAARCRTGWRGRIWWIQRPAARPPARNDAVALGDLVLNQDVEIRTSDALVGNEPAHAIGAGNGRGDAAEAPDEVSADEFVDQLELSVI